MAVTGPLASDRIGAGTGETAIAHAAGSPTPLNPLACSSTIQPDVVQRDTHAAAPPNNDGFMIPRSSILTTRQPPRAADSSISFATSTLRPSSPGRQAPRVTRRRAAFLEAHGPVAIAGATASATSSSGRQPSPLQRDRLPQQRARAFGSTHTMVMSGCRNATDSDIVPILLPMSIIVRHEWASASR